MNREMNERRRNEQRNSFPFILYFHTLDYLQHIFLTLLHDPKVPQGHLLYFRTYFEAEKRYTSIPKLTLPAPINATLIADMVEEHYSRTGILFSVVGDECAGLRKIRTIDLKNRPLGPSVCSLFFLCSLFTLHAQVS